VLPLNVVCDFCCWCGACVIAVLVVMCVLHDGSELSGSMILLKYVCMSRVEVSSLDIASSFMYLMIAWVVSYNC
jgi:hypothetical protein